MNTEIAQDRIKTALKQVLKKQNHTYSDVAKVWECSLPTVKRLLGKEELPLSKLLTLLDWLSLTLSDLQKLSDSENLDQPFFTLKQNEFLAKNPPQFALLMKLYEEETPQAVAKKYGLPMAMIERWLMQLENHDLVRVGVGGKIKPAYVKMPALNGALGGFHFRNLMDRFNSYFKDQIATKLAGQKGAGSFSYSAMEVRPETWKSYQNKIFKLLEELASVAKQEDLQYKKSELKMGVFGFGFNLDEIGAPSLKMVEDVFAHYLEDVKRD